MNGSIVEAREKYFAEHPFNPKEKALLTTDENNIPVGFITLPDMGELSVVATKFGYEFLAHVRTDEDVDKWISAVMEQAAICRCSWDYVCPCILGYRGAFAGPD